MAIYNHYKNLSNVIFDTKINTKNTIDIFKDAYKSNNIRKDVIRDKLLNNLINEYEKLKTYNLKQLHFHLPNNESFLRMHRPHKFGDNLSAVRSTVKYVNDNKIYTHGFEEGRITNGFRFVYPLFNEYKTHIGSVEISFSAISLIKEIKKQYNLDSNFIINKDIVEQKVFEEDKNNYIKSPHKKFYFQKNINDTIIDHNISEAEKVDLSDKILEGKPISIYHNNINIIKTIIPIKNPITNKVVAALCICEEDLLLLHSLNNVYIFSISVAFLLGVILFLFYKQVLAKRKLTILNKHLDRKINLEIRKNRKKDLQILNQAKMASTGEILNNISHQWRQPLNAISTSASGLILHKEINTLDDDNFNLLTNSIIEHTQYLSNTIKTFSDYVHESNARQVLCIQDRVEKVLSMIESNFKYNYVTITKDFTNKNIHTKAILGEISQVILNILNNAKDALVENNSIENRKVKISVKHKNSNIVLITIEDNAGGIKENIMDKIFDPYFTTKHKAIGTGVGLYMCYELVHKNLNGKLYVKNTDKGAKFFIELPILQD